MMRWLDFLEDGQPAMLDSMLSEAGITKAVILDYMKAAPLAASTRMMEEDPFDPTAPDIPLYFSSDGTWLWASVSEVVLERHGMPPNEEFIKHVAACGGVFPQVTEKQLRAAQALLAGEDEEEQFFPRGR